MLPLNSVTIITQNKAMRELIRRIDKVADSDSSILLIGETGVGKEVFANYIHHLSHRGEKTSVKISLAAMPAELMESELFGYEKGAFTNANHLKKGMFEMAQGGSLFLDDIDDTPLNIQAKLLRVLESREIRHIGGSKSIPIDVRLICSTKKDLKNMVAQKVFREDLFYRINTVQIRIPPLRQRKEDIPLLIEYFIRHFSPQKKLTVSTETMNFLMSYHWPGNVRELRNVIHRASLFAEKEIKRTDLPDDLANFNFMDQIVNACKVCYSNKIPYSDVIKCLEVKLLTDALESSKGNQSKAAQSLGLKLSTFRDKLKKLKIQPPSC